MVEAKRMEELPVGQSFKNVTLKLPGQRSGETKECRAEVQGMVRDKQGQGQDWVMSDTHRRRDDADLQKKNKTKTRYKKATHCSVTCQGQKQSREGRTESVGGQF